MPQSDHNMQYAGNVASIPSSEAHQTLSEIRTLRQRVLLAWQARGVVLTDEERRELKAEIAYTCDLLTVLTSRD